MAADGKRRVVFTWDLGEGMGHMVPYLPLVRCLRGMGGQLIFVKSNFGLVEKLVGRRLSGFKMGSQREDVFMGKETIRWVKEGI